MKIHIEMRHRKYKMTESAAYQEYIDCEGIFLVVLSHGTSKQRVKKPRRKVFFLNIFIQFFDNLSTGVLVQPSDL